MQATISGLIHIFRADYGITTDHVRAMVQFEPGLLMDSSGTLLTHCKRFAKQVGWRGARPRVRVKVRALQALCQAGALAWGQA